MTRSASGMTRRAIRSTPGDTPHQGGLASTSKKTAPVRRTALRTSDSTSMPPPRSRDCDCDALWLIPSIGQKKWTVEHWLRRLRGIAFVSTNRQAEEATMLDLKTLKDTTATISDEALAALKASFSGRVIVPGDVAYDGARRVWNSLIDRRPGLIVQAHGLADVVAAVRFARTHGGLLVSVRGGGHNVSGSAVCDGGLVIDLRDMHAVRVDRKAMTVHVQGGARLADVDRETQVHGLVAVTGNVSDTGIAGLTLCGGMGNLRRKFGLAIDNLVSVEIVTASGEVKTASAHENVDLFWAVRGGGGNFGIVTSFEFRLHPLGPEVYFAAQFFAIDDAPQVMRKWRDFVEAAGDEISSLAMLWTVPSVDGFPPEMQGKRAFVYGALYAGSADDGEKALAPLR